MSLRSTVIGLWTFDNTLSDEALSNDFVPITTTSVSYDYFDTFDLLSSKVVTRRGFEFKENGQISAGNDFTFGDSYSILMGFWWYSPVALGTTRHTITKQTTGFVAPILSKAETSISDGLEIVTSGEYIIDEIGYSATQNAIRVSLCGSGTSVTHIFTSTPYDPGLRNVFIEIYPPAVSYMFVQIFIDGKASPIYVGPSTMSVTTANLTVNKCSFGYTAHKKTQTGGLLGDLVILNETPSIYDNPPGSFVRFGYQFLTEEAVEEIGITSYSTYSSFHGLSFTQKSTTTTNHIYSDGGNIFAARSDGAILKGYRPIWDTELNFINPQSVSLLDTKTSSDGSVNWSTEGLNIKGSTIKV